MENKEFEKNKEINMYKKIDFQKEWCERVDVVLKRLGYRNISSDLLQKTIQLFAICERKIENTRRSVHVSKELQEKEDKRIDLIVKKIIDGDDVNPYLSKTIEEIGFNDMLLNDWGIYHFHLGEKIDSSGFIERTKDVLFGIITDHDAYLIDIMPHDNWSEIGLLEIVYANWSKILEPREVKNFIPDWTITKNDEVFKARKACINYLIKLKNGKIFRPSNLGYTLSAYPQSVVIKAKTYYRKLRIAQEIYDKEVEYIVNILKNTYKYKKQEPFEFRAVFTEEAVGIIEIDSDVFLLLDKN